MAIIPYAQTIYCNKRMSIYSVYLAFALILDSIFRLLESPILEDYGVKYEKEE